MNKSLSFMIVIIGTMVACVGSERHANEPSDFQNIYTLTKTNEKNFQLDSVTAQESSMIQILEKGSFLPSINSGRLLCALNRYENSIIIYDINTGTIAKKLYFNKEGPNGVGEISGFVIKNADTIFVYNYYANKIFLMNEAGQVKGNYSIMPVSMSHIPIPPTTLRPPILLGNSLYLNTFGTADPWKVKSLTTDEIVLCLDIRTKEITYQFAYPKIYESGAWGTAFHFYYTTYSDSLNRFIYSFPVEQNILVADPKTGQVEEFFAGSSLDDDTQFPLFKERMTEQPNFDERTKYNLTMFSYKGIYYDPFHNFYLRVALLPISEEIYNSGDPVLSRTQKISFIILDSSFNKVGELPFESPDYMTDMVFFQEDGVHIARRTKHENQLTFDVFQIVKK